jgi:flagellar hook protein FlgE
MDVIGNNIANVNTTAYKAQSITFNELMYQTTKRASGANATTGVGGTNAGQIGLGVKVGAINTNITTQGATQTTNLPFDLSITGSSFFIVNNGSETFFTRAGSFYVDGAGNLAMTSTGYNVMGWGVDPTTGEIRKDTVEPLRVMGTNSAGEDIMTYPAEATTKATITGIADKNDADIQSKNGKIINLDFYDNLGYQYTARFSVHLVDGDTGQYYTKLDDILDSNGQSIGADKMNQVGFGSDVQTVGANDPYLRATGTNATARVDIAVTAPAAVNFQVDSGVSYTVTGGAIDPQNPAPAGGAPTPFPTAANIGALYGTAAETALTTSSNASFDNNGNLTLTSSANGSTTTYPKIVGATSTVVSVAINNADPAFTAKTFAVGAANQYNIAADGTTITDAAGAAVTGFTMADIETLYGTSLEGARAFTIAADGTLTVTQKDVENAALLEYIPGTGKFARIGGNMEGLINLNFADTEEMSNFQDIELNFSPTLMTDNRKTSTLGAERGGTGDDKGLGTGRRTGDMLEVVVQDDGRIYANYDNGQSRLLGQIATATFSNASGLEKKGDNLYGESMNSGAFDGIGEDIKVGGGYMTSGVLEMSNVDLSSEFTEMITTQRGFQANSRIITVSDTLLEELTNLKR